VYRATELVPSYSGSEERQNAVDGEQFKQWKRDPSPVPCAL
jgi:hypothetical protein